MGITPSIKVVSNNNERILEMNKKGNRDAKLKSLIISKELVIASYGSSCLKLLLICFYLETNIPFNELGTCLNTKPNQFVDEYTKYKEYIFLNRV